ncbi:MAG: nickel pincer cofactor biosynthesis protein LarC [Gemmataceae bacterium]|nr:nickel pincer cofactor biosynthesis protein LarC [Gemmataceae bacterium]MCI0738319.1 nickel pincer cofactor biosynthesis protein LarC [Gemmataceae bacterium]
MTRVAHFDCFSGISGDMTLGALIDAGVSSDAIRDGIASLGLPVTVKVEKVRKGGFAATKVTVEAPHEHKHRHLHHIEEMLARGTLSDKQRALAQKIFRRLAEAEAAAHGIAVEKVHFHEVGALDSIADIAGSAVGLDHLGVDKFTSSSVTTGVGMVQCAHGLMPIPTPGTAALLKGVPLRPSSIQSELTTPTGAAILTSVVTEWTDSPDLTVEHIGHGAGQRELSEQPNILRLFVGQSAAVGEGAPLPHGRGSDSVWVLETNLDDVPGEIVGYCMDRLFEAGALDVFTAPIQMKKNRPGVILSVIAPESALAALEEILFRETLTFGIRRYRVERRKLLRKEATVTTPWGPIKGKLGWLESKPPVFTPEYEDCARVAREQNVPLREVFQKAQQSYKEPNS